MSDTVLVTGGTGFVAGWCIVELMQRGYRVRTTVRSAARQDAVRAAVATRIPPDGRLSFAVADLTRDDGWTAAIDGCRYVLHVASPMSMRGGDAQTLVQPARDGTLRVLRAAAAAGIERVVMTSSCAAVNRGLQSGDTVNDETVWTSVDDPDLNSYRLSKVLAERAAWDFMAAHTGSMTLTAVLPSAIFGPVLTREGLGSVELIDRQLRGRMPGLPHVGFCVVDVRDLAALHVRAMTAPLAAGERFIAAGEFVWMAEVASILRERLGDRAAKVPRRHLPNLLVRGLARVVPAFRPLVPMLGRKHLYVSDKARRVLGFDPRPVADTLAQCAESLLAAGTAA